jgi:FdhD protein
MAAAIDSTELNALVVQPEARLLRAVPGAPQLSAAACEPVREIQVVDDHGEHRRIQVPAERALTVFVDQRELVTLMTLGAAPEFLVLGYLYNQRLIDGAAQLESITVDWQLGAAAVTTRSPLHELKDRSARRLATTACGQGSVFGDLMTQIDTIRLPGTGVARICQSTLHRLLETMRRTRNIHASAGSVHSCALFRGADMLLSVEDVGRHNAVDTITGWMVMHGVAGADKILFTTARLTSEMVMKAAQSGIPIAVSRNGVSTMAYDLASRLGMALFGRAVNRHFLCYVGAERFDVDSATE